jgi:hypothetical protein
MRQLNVGPAIIKGVEDGVQQTGVSKNDDGVDGRGRILHRMSDLAAAYPKGGVPDSKPSTDSRGPRQRR